MKSDLDLQNFNIKSHPAYHPQKHDNDSPMRTTNYIDGPVLGNTHKRDQNMETDYMKSFKAMR